VHVAPEVDLPAVVTDPAARKEFAKLTEALVEASIEILDLLDGDPDLEISADDFKDDQGL
jgi:hypothetical protein